MFNVNSSNIIQTTDNNYDDSKCNIEEDDENVIGASPNSKMERSATFAALRPDTEKTQHDLLKVRHHLTELSDQWSGKLATALSRCSLLNKEISNINTQSSAFQKQIKDLKNENEILTKDCNHLMSKVANLKEQLVQSNLLNQQSNKLIDQMRVDLKENQEKLKLARKDF